MILLLKSRYSVKNEKKKSSEEDQKETYEFIKENALIVTDDCRGEVINFSQNNTSKEADNLKNTKRAYCIQNNSVEEEKTRKKNISFNATDKFKPKVTNKSQELIIQKDQTDSTKSKHEGSESIKTKSIVQGHMYQIDLESVLHIEQKLWCILDCFTGEASSVNVFEFCEEWWDLVDSHTLSNIHSVFVEDMMRRSLRKSAILEFLAITMINFLSSECKSNADLHGNLKVLIFYVHQNYLIFINCILQKLPPYNNTNIWVQTLK